MTDGNVTEIRPGAAAERPKRRGASPERMRELTRRRLELGKTDPTKLGGRRAKPRLTAAEVKEAALKSAAELLVEHRMAAINKLVLQLDNPDPGIAQRAAFKILEYTDGKPTQPIETSQNGPTVIEYRTAALAVVPLPAHPDAAGGFVPGVGLEETA